MVFGEIKRHELRVCPARLREPVLVHAEPPRDPTRIDHVAAKSRF
jgi:hypothetical protein